MDIDSCGCSIWKVSAGRERSALIWSMVDNLITKLNDIGFQTQAYTEYTILAISGKFQLRMQEALRINQENSNQENDDCTIQKETLAECL